VVPLMMAVLVRDKPVTQPPIDSGCAPV